MMPDLANRNRQHEWMDAPDVEPADLRNALAFIRRVNRWLGYTRASIAHLERLTQNWPTDRPIRILDVATGSADIPLAILHWADRRGVRVEITAIDLHERTVTEALAAVPKHERHRLSIFRADALRLPFADRSFDVAHTAMFLHHLDDEDAARVLREMDRVASHALIAADLLRDRRAYFWISLFTSFAHPMVKHDARVSVGQAFSPAEVLRLRDSAAITYCEYYRHFGHRFVLAGRKS